MKVERIKDPEEETQDMTSIPPVTTCSEVEDAAPHVDYHHGYRRAGEAVAKRRKIHVPAVTAASPYYISTITGTCGLERVCAAVQVSAAYATVGMKLPNREISLRPREFVIQGSEGEPA
uniref:(California timema) hypothetical protein n=1 Tax=Timema californicum TaxID=61474 RepID=A0A7R9JJZ7_TIMCA|nr:unnamed protein product [Timema californicum]